MTDGPPKRPPVANRQAGLPEAVAKLLDDAGSASHQDIPEAVAKLLGAAPAADADQIPEALRSLLAAQGVAPVVKQQGLLKVGLVTPYNCTELEGVVEALRTVENTIGLIGLILHEGSETVGLHLPLHTPTYNFRHLVRDHRDHYKHHAHLGGSRRWNNPEDEIRFHLDEAGRLVRSHATDAIDDLFDMGIHVLVIVPGCARSSYAAKTARRLGAPCYVAALDEPVLFSNDIDGRELPQCLMFVTSSDYADADRLRATELHLRMKGLSLASVLYTPSPAAESIIAQALLPGDPPHALVRDATPEALLELLPDILVLSPGVPLADAVGSLAAVKQIPVLPL